MTEEVSERIYIVGEIGKLNELLAQTQVQERDQKRIIKTLQDELKILEGDYNRLIRESDSVRLADIVDIKRWKLVSSLVEQHSIILDSRRIDLAAAQSVLIRTQEELVAIAESREGLREELAEWGQLCYFPIRSTV